ncbi:MAG: carboxymuconolactone decarboxylase family protein [Thermodesulfobacteriota bacterium]
MGARMNKWGFFFLVVVLLSGVSFLSPCPDYYCNLIQLTEAPAWSAELASGGQKISKTGIPYAADTPSAGSEEIYKAILARRGGKLANLDRMLLNSPAFAQGWNEMFGAIRGKLAVSLKLRELAIVTIAVMNKADYEWQAHAPLFLTAGGNQEQLNAIKKGVLDAIKNPKLFDESERATLALTYEMTRNVTVKKDTMAKIRSLLPTQQVVELIGTIAGYNMVSRFLIATGIDPEE